MNANELIELLDKNSGDGDTPVRKAVTLIRRQQAEIEVLKAKTLKDEEISEVMYQCDWQYDPESFARAILRKAQEK